MSAWRCRVCEGVNQEGRVCQVCGAAIPEGEALPVALRTRKPSTMPPAAPVSRPRPPAWRPPPPEPRSWRDYFRAPPPPPPAPRPAASGPLPPTPTEVFGSDPFGPDPGERGFFW